MAKDDDGSGEVVREFAEAVDLTPAQLEDWLQTEESRSVGAKDDAQDESTGHAMGRQIVELLHKRKADYGDEGYQRMREVTGSVHRHLAPPVPSPPDDLRIARGAAGSRTFDRHPTYRR